nr:hypothetical protein CFP56_12656 [Quercus suber]
MDKKKKGKFSSRAANDQNSGAAHQIREVEDIFGQSNTKTMWVKFFSSRSEFWVQECCFLGTKEEDQSLAKEILSGVLSGGR